MSHPITKAEILFLQRLAASCGLYTGPLDGKMTKAVSDAEEKLAEAAAKLKTQLGTFDARTETNIATLMPPAQKLARQFMKAVSGFQHVVRIISGTRTYAEQDALFAIGRTVGKSGKFVTKARGGQSNHNFAIAWDVGIFDAAGRYMTGATAADVTAYKALGALAKSKVPGLEWGGDWTSIVDRPHYQVATGKSAKEVRTLFEAGKPLI
jgi:peptidoglycan L-alanyl-D-glutamate endopeptidase CwlK